MSRITQHLQTSSHVSYATNPENWRELESVAESLPSLADLEAEACGEPSDFKSPDNSNMPPTPSSSQISSSQTISFASITSIKRNSTRDQKFINLNEIVWQKKQSEQLQTQRALEMANLDRSEPDSEADRTSEYDRIIARRGKRKSPPMMPYVTRADADCSEEY